MDRFGEGNRGRDDELTAWLKEGAEICKNGSGPDFTVERGGELEQELQELEVAN